MKLRKTIGLIMLIGGIIMFVMFNQKNKGYLEISDSGSSMKRIDLEMHAGAGNDYLVKFWFLDEETGYQWASASADFSIYFNDQQIHTKKYSASSSDDSGGVKRAQDTDEIRYTPTDSGKLILKGELTKGDKWEVKIYKNMNDQENMAPPAALIVAVIGLVLALKKKKHIV